MVKEAPELFCRALGQKVSESKTIMFFSRNVSDHTRVAIRACFGFNVIENLGKYLGMPLLHERVPKHVCQGIIDRVKGRLNGWSASSLSLEGCATLINFTMHSIKIPRGIVEEVERLCRNFLWGHTDSRSRAHLSNWAIVMQPTSRGGLGIKRSSEFNNACLAKICWGSNRA